MTIRNDSYKAQYSHLQRALACGLVLIGLSGCGSGSLSSLVEPDRIDYKSAGKAPTLEVPPDLTQLQRENRYAVPETNRGTATASGYNLQQGARPAAAQVIAPA